MRHAFSNTCPKCNKENWIVEDYSPGDYSGQDPEAINCWNCKHKWLLDGCEEWTSLEDAFDVDGQKKVK